MEARRPFAAAIARFAAFSSKFGAFEHLNHLTSERVALPGEPGELARDEGAVVRIRTLDRRRRVLQGHRAERAERGVDRFVGVGEVVSVPRCWRNGTGTASSRNTSNSTRPSCA